MSGDDGSGQRSRAVRDLASLPARSKALVQLAQFQNWVRGLASLLRPPQEGRSEYRLRYKISQGNQPGAWGCTPNR